MERERITGPKRKNEEDWSRFCESEERGEEMIMLGSSRGHMSWKSAQILDSSSWDKSSHHHKLMAVDNFL